MTHNKTNCYSDGKQSNSNAFVNRHLKARKQKRIMCQIVIVLKAMDCYWSAVLALDSLFFW